MDHFIKIFQSRTQLKNYPTPPHMAFSEISWAFPVTYLAMAWRRQARPRGAGGEESAAGSSGFWPQSRSAPLSASQASLGHALAPPPPSHGQISIANVKRHLGWGGVDLCGCGSPGGLPLCSQSATVLAWSILCAVCTSSRFVDSTISLR